MSDRTLPASWVLSAGCLAVWALLAAAQFGLLPFARYAWAFNLWQYLPPAAAFGLALGSLALCSTRVRRRIMEISTGFAVRLATPGRAGAGALGLLLVPLLLWLLRERQLLGDSQVLFQEASLGTNFLFPDVGATLLVIQLLHMGDSLALPFPEKLAIIQAAICACGALALLFVSRAAARLAPGWEKAATAFLLCGGLVRIFAGHVEVYVFVMAAAAAYLWSALAFLRGDAPAKLPGLVLGVAIWLHLSALALVPSLLALPFLADPRAPRAKRVHAAARSLGLAALPSVAFFAVVAVAGYHDDLADAFAAFREITGTSSDPDALHRWVRGWGGPPSRGTDYVFLSLPHLKYLVNAAYLLSPAALPVLALALLRGPRDLWATPTSRFLCTACLPLLAYALALRPVWGPFDWDLFAITAFFFSALAGHWLFRVAREPASAALVSDFHTWLVGTSLLFVAIPFLLMAGGPARDAGPFTGKGFGFHLIEPDSEEHGPLSPWL